MKDVVDVLNERIAELEQQLAEAQADAERWQNILPLLVECGKCGAPQCCYNDPDQAIGAAIDDGSAK